MDLNIYIISSLYKEYLNTLPKKNQEVKRYKYDEYYSFILKDSSEMVPTYCRTLNNMGYKANCSFANDKNLMKKWNYENGHKNLNVKETILNQIKSLMPNVIWIDNIDFLDSEWLKLVRNQVISVKLIFANICAPYSKETIDRLKDIDFVITCTPGLKMDIEKHGVKSYLVYHAFDPLILNELTTSPPSKKYGFVFCGSLFTGSGYHDQRIEFLEEILERGLEISVFANSESRFKITLKQLFYLAYNLLRKLGLQIIINNFSIFKKFENYKNSPIKGYSKKLRDSFLHPVFGIDMYRVLKNSDLVLNIHGEVAGSYAGNVRLFEATGVGCCLLTDDKVNMKDLFDPQHEAVLYNSIDDCILKAKWLLENESERKRIAKAGQDRTLKLHKVENRCHQIIEIINEELLNVISKKTYS